MPACSATLKTCTYFISELTMWSYIIDVAWGALSVSRKAKWCRIHAYAKWWMQVFLRWTAFRFRGSSEYLRHNTSLLGNIANLFSAAPCILACTDLGLHRVLVGRSCGEIRARGNTKDWPWPLIRCPEGAMIELGVNLCLLFLSASRAKIPASASRR